MRLWVMEIRKILGRPILNLGLCLLMAFLMFAFWVDASKSRAEIDGKVYYGISAIEANRRLAKEDEGDLTLEKIEQIVGRFGLSGFIRQEEQEFSRVREGNFCNQWVTNNLTDFYDTKEVPERFMEGRRWQEYGKHFLQTEQLREDRKDCQKKEMKFGYTEGWNYFHGIWSWSVLALNVWLILIAAPVFSEEYNRKTIHVLLATAHGTWKDVWAKIAACMAVAITAFLAVTFLLFGITAAVYGLDGLTASAGMIDFRALFGGMELNVAQFSLLTFGAKLAAVCLNICVTLFFSSRCRRSMSAAVFRLLMFYPLSWLMNEFIYQMLFDLIYDNGILYEFWGWLSLDLLSVLCISTTYYLSWSAVIGVPPNWAGAVFVVLAAVMTGCIWRVFVNYRKGE